jgi:hypothetical protein
MLYSVLSMSIELSGQLSEDVLGNLLQYLSLNLTTGCLQVRRPPSQMSQMGEVYFEQGKVVHAVAGTKMAIPALAVLMQWSVGTFQFKAGLFTQNKTIDLPLDSLLLETAYNADMAALASDLELETSISATSIMFTLPIPTGTNFLLSVRAIQLMRKLDSHSTMLEISRQMSLTFSDLVDAAHELINYKLADVVASPLVHPNFIKQLGEAMVGIMGPLGEVVLEDVIYDLGLEPNAIPEKSLPELLREVKAQLPRNDCKYEFCMQVRNLSGKYSILFDDLNLVSPHLIPPPSKPAGLPHGRRGRS